MVASVDSDPLERRRGESELAHRCFICYWGLGEQRTLQRLYEKLAQESTDEKKPSLSTIQGWSSKFDWAERLRQLSTIAAHKQAEAMESAHAEALEKYRLQALGTGLSLVQLSHKLRDVVKNRLATLDPESLTASDLAQLLRASVQASHQGLELQAQALGIEQLMDQVTLSQ